VNVRPTNGDPVASDSEPSAATDGYRSGPAPRVGPSSVPDRASTYQDATPSVPWLRAKRRESAYDVPTEEKRAFGRRLKEARERAGLSLTEAATRLGYSQPVQMSNMENGIRPPTLKVIIEGARLYGTTADYLCGLAEDCDSDPVHGVRRHLAARVLADFQALTRTVAEVSAERLRKAMPSAAEGRRMAELVLEMRVSAAGLQSSEPAAGVVAAARANVVQKATLAAEAARAYLVAVKRADNVLRPNSSRGGEAEGVDSTDTPGEAKQVVDRAVPGEALAPLGQGHRPGATSARPEVSQPVGIGRGASSTAPRPFLQQPLPRGDTVQPATSRPRGTRMT
jgi:transcriptional regulator with XRE-family HTH domain